MVTGHVKAIGRRIIRQADERPISLAQHAQDIPRPGLSAVTQHGSVCPEGCRRRQNGGLDLLGGRSFLCAQRPSGEVRQQEAEHGDVA
jgi:hypothetical protein